VRDRQSAGDQSFFAACNCEDVGIAALLSSFELGSPRSLAKITVKRCTNHVTHLFLRQLEMVRGSVWISLAYLLTPSFCLHRLENYKEDLRVKPLRDGRVSTTFSFLTVLEDAVPRHPTTLELPDERASARTHNYFRSLNCLRCTAQHYALFPLTLGQILREYAITELHLSLNAGKWNYDDWGHPPEVSVGTGAELWAWMGVNEVMTCVPSTNSYGHVH
jgi:hypothetical protein